MLNSTKPSEWARRLVRGAYDLHVHVEPDVMRRQVTDLQLARRCWDVGLAGFALKSHYVPTAERAAVLNEALGGEVRVLGALTLNSSVGGLNPIAVEIAAREGARILWMPTLDAANHRDKHADLPPGATPPMWMALQRELDAQGMTVPVVDVLDGDGLPLPAAREVLQLAARHQLVVATGHLSAYESRVVAEAAFEAGVRHVIATHPEFPQQDMSLDDQKALAGQGAFLERCFTTPFTGKYEWARMADNIRATGAEHTIITTDLGQPHNPPVEDGLPLMADALRAAAFTDEEITTMIVSNSLLLARPASRAQASPAQASPGRRPPVTTQDGFGRLLVVSAHAADFVWRAAGDIAVVTAAFGEAHVVCLSYGEHGESPGAWKQPGMTVDQVKKIRRAEAEAAGQVLGATMHFLDQGDYPLPDTQDLVLRLAELMRELQPGVILTHSKVDPYNYDHPQAADLTLRARMVAQAQGRAVGAPGDRRAAGVPLRAPPARDVRVPAGRAR